VHASNSNSGKSLDGFSGKDESLLLTSSIVQLEITDDLVKTNHITLRNWIDPASL